MTPYHDANGVTIYHGDCLEVMRGLPDGSADLIVADPPYYRVKDSWWDNQWKTPASFLEWLGLVVDELARLLKPSGSLYLFASPQMAARVEVLISDRLNVLNHLVWSKDFSRANQAEKEALRSFWGESERIIFAEHHGSDGHAMNGAGYDEKCDEAGRDVFGVYIKAVRSRYNLTSKDLTAAIGAHGAVNHGGACSNWERGYNVPTREHYDKLQATYPGCFDREYEDLRREYEDLRREYEDLRRPFNMTARKQFTDVWEFSPVSPYPNKHECEKPPALLHHIIDVSSRPGAVVLDPFLGSGRSLEVAQTLGRVGIGIEVQELWCRRAAERCSQLSLFQQAA